MNYAARVYPRAYGGTFAPTSIPARTGEPYVSRVYPRAYGGTSTAKNATRSIPARTGEPALYVERSIPARTGEPRVPTTHSLLSRTVYPRAYGGTQGAKVYPRAYGGTVAQQNGSIPARTGEPNCCVVPASGLSPRVRGNPVGEIPGLSPRVRGNLVTWRVCGLAVHQRSIPARTGEPDSSAGSLSVYPRAYGGTQVRSRWASVYPRAYGGTLAGDYAEVYPRAYGGT